MYSDISKCFYIIFFMAAIFYSKKSLFLKIIEKFNEGGWTTGWDDEQQVPYAYCGTTWLSYDNEESIALKVYTTIIIFSRYYIQYTI